MAEGKLPLIHWKILEKIYELLGYRFVHHKGSHRSYRNEKTGKRIQLIKRKEIPRGTLREKIRKLGIDRKKFFELYKKVK